MATPEATRRTLALATPVALRPELSYFASVVLQTAINDLKRINAYFIDVIRWPIFPLTLFVIYQLSYGIAGRPLVEEADAVGFLLVGMVGLVVWGTTIWSGGYAIEMERGSGTAAALFLSPASRVAVILGYGVGGLIWGLPAIAMIAVLALLTGARFDVADPPAVAAALVALAMAALASGFALASLFILSRRANMVANFIQQPIYLLAGFAVPRASLPWWLHAPSELLPIAHAVDAVRASALRGASLADCAPALSLALLTSLAFVVVGILALGRVERVAKHRGELDLY
jgi:ABC-2 type transport system permease protein